MHANIMTQEQLQKAAEINFELFKLPKVEREDGHFYIDSPSIIRLFRIVYKSTKRGNYDNYEIGKEDAEKIQQIIENERARLQAEFEKI